MHIIDWFSNQILKLLFDVKRPFALVSYYLRKRRRYNEKFPIRWITNARLIAEDLLLIEEEDGEKAIDTAFINTMMEGRANAQKLASRYNKISIGMALFLLMGVFSIDLPVIIGGIKLTLFSGLNEVLIMCLASITALSMAPMLSDIVLSSAIKGAIAAYYPESVLYFRQQSAFPEESPAFYNSHYRPSLIWTVGTNVASSIAQGFHMILFLGIVVFGIGTHWLIYSYVYLQPSLPAPWTTVVVFSSVFIEVWSFVFLLLFVVPLPYRDYVLQEKFKILDQFNPAQARTEKSKAYDQDIVDEQNMINRGYIKPDEKKGD